MSTATAAMHKNPFPGLRPFREDEEYLFFGRENQVDALVDKLAATRFLAVVGTSGSGKSSLVNCGLRPALHGGLMARAGTAWRMAQFRPGSNPMRAMARALAEDGVLFRDYQAAGLTLAEIVDTTLRMSKLGLIDICEQAQLGEDVNLLVVVDQFEELFRYRRLGAGQQENVYGVSEEATAFVNLLLEAKAQTTYPIYVVLTMRSDFLGDCAQFTGLAEAINAGQYLVPRMTRDERRAAISGPVGVGGAEISPVLLTRLVNDVGDNPDQLSILQHALNRTWYQRERSGDNGALDLPHYQAIGTMAHALDQHAERAYADLTTPRHQHICEKLFKALTDKATDPRGVRRPTTLATLCTLVDATPAEVTEVIDVFRKPSRSFLMPAVGEALGAQTIIDISHESLMRVWQRLMAWADDEARSARMYRRLAETAALRAEGQASLWRDPDLQMALDWRDRNQPNETWASPYHPGFAAAVRFLTESSEAREAERAEGEQKAKEELERQREKTERDQRDLRRFRIAACAFLVLTVMAIGGAIWAVRAQSQAQKSVERMIGAQSEAQKSVDRMIGYLVDQLAGLDGELALYALEKLNQEIGEENAVHKVPAKLFESSQWFADVSFALDQFASRDPDRGPWVRGVRQSLFTRLSSGSRLGAQPSAADDERLNRRILIAGGAFQMGSLEGAGNPSESPQHRVKLSPFRIQEHEVTNAEYRRFDPSHDRGARDDHPVVNASWHNAVAYAAWLGGSLPTEAQWEFAARGEAGRTYPWGEEKPACDRANSRECASAVRPVKVDRERGKTPEGVYDLAGNAQEWCRDWYASYPREEQRDPLGPRTGSTRVLRGGSFRTLPHYLHGASRNVNDPGLPDVNIGFRVVWPASGGPD